MRKKIMPYILPVGLFSIVVALVFGRALFPGAGEMIWGDDIHRTYYFYRQFFDSFLREGIWPWWNPYIFGGAPFIANPMINIWYPPTWLFFFLPLNIAYSWHIALHILWAMLGMYVLLRLLLRPTSYVFHPDIAAWVGGLLFGLSGFFMARTWAGHVDVIAAASWMPFVIMSNVKCQMSNEKTWKRNCVIAAVVLAMQLLAGYQTMAFFTLEAVGLLTLFFCLAKRSAVPAVRATVTVLLGVGLAGIQIIPLQEFFRASIRTFTLPYSWNSYGSLTWQSMKQFFNPFIFGDQLTYSGPPPNFAEHAFFVGRVGILVASIGSVIALRKASVWFWFFALAAFFGLWVSLGPNAPIDLQYILWKIVPMYKYLRIPARHLILVVFGLSGMVGLAIYAIRSMRLRLVFVGLITIEMIFYARHFIALKPIPEARHDAELIKILKQDIEPYRVLPNFGVWVEPRDSLDFDAVASNRIFSSTGYDPSILRSYYEFIDIANGNAPGFSILTHDVQVPYLNLFSQATDFLNIKYILVPRAYDPLGGSPSGQAASRFRLIREDIIRDYRLYENKTVKPRFFFEDTKEGRVEIEKYSPNEIVLSTDNKNAATLFSSEVFYPGWEGFVDGQKVDVIKTNHAFRALSVPAGRHTVVYRYSPRIFLIGGLVTVITALLCVGIIFKKH